LKAWTKRNLFFLQLNLKGMKLINRMQAPTPPFFKKLRTIGLILAAVSTTIVAAPVALPAIVIQIAGYLAVASTVVSAVSQTAVYGE
jgi:hypothetical protein